MLSLVSVFTCSLSVTDGVIWDEIFSKVTHCVGCMVLCCLFYCYPHPEAERKEFDVFWRFGIFWKNAHQSSSFLKKICIYFVFSYGIKFYLKDSINSKYVFPWQPKKFLCTRVCSTSVHVRKTCLSRNLYHSAMKTIMYFAQKTMSSFESWSKQTAKHCLHWAIW